MNVKKIEQWRITRKTMTAQECLALVDKAAFPLGHAEFRDQLGRIVHAAALDGFPNGSYIENRQWKPIPSASTLITVTIKEPA